MKRKVIADNLIIKAKNCETRQLPFPTLLHLQQNQPPEGPVQGQHQIQGIPSPATAGSSRQELIQRAIGYPLKMPPEESSVWFQVLYYDTLVVLQYIILNIQNLPTCIAQYQR